MVLGGGGLVEQDAEDEEKRAEEEIREREKEGEHMSQLEERRVARIYRDTACSLDLVERRIFARSSLGFRN